MAFIKLLLVVTLIVGGVHLSASACYSQTAEGPVPINKPFPTYPALALARRVSGAVLVDIQVNREGRVTSAQPIMGPELLRESAKKSALGWRFKPFESTSETYSVRLTFIFHDADYVAPKKPDFTSPYLLERNYPIMAVDCFNDCPKQKKR